MIIALFAFGSTEEKREGDNSRFIVTYQYPDTTIEAGADTLDIFLPDMFNFKDSESAYDYFLRNSYTFFIFDYSLMSALGVATPPSRAWDYSPAWDDAGIFLLSPSLASRIRYYNSDCDPLSDRPTYVSDVDLSDNYFPISKIKIGDTKAEVLEKLGLRHNIPLNDLQTIEIRRSKDPTKDTTVDFSGANLYNGVEFEFRKEKLAYTFGDDGEVRSSEIVYERVDTLCSISSAELYIDI